MERFVYSGENLKEISFPLGGIGSGSIGLAGNGRLIDWEIFNRPNKGLDNGFSFFAVKAESGGELLDARVLQGDLPAPFTGERTGDFGFGPGRQTLAGVPHFSEVTFLGKYPLAELEFSDSHFPAKVVSKAFNPFIPLNDKDSSLPSAFFEVEFTNNQDIPLDISLCLSLQNPFPSGTTFNKIYEKDDCRFIKLSSNEHKPGEPGYGDLTISTEYSDVSWQEYWYRGAWFDGLTTFWNDFTTPGKLKNRKYDDFHNNSELVKHQQTNDVASLVAHLKLGVGESKKVRFLLSWSFPTVTNFWNPEECCDDNSCGENHNSSSNDIGDNCSNGSQDNCCDDKNTWKNYYATIFDDSLAVAHYGLKHWERLYQETSLFQQTLFSSTFPDGVIEAISANISIFKSPTCLRLEDGSFYGFEGCNCDSGCCEGSCSHVWNYAYALPFLFPALERSMRELDYTYNMREDGGMGFRLQLPLGRVEEKFRPCVDGQLGGVIKAYRDWKISGDTEWLRTIWSKIVKSLEFTWAESNEDKWDLNKDGVIEGRQHHTLDMELFGPNSWLNGFYLAALKGAAEMAKHLGDNMRAEEYLELFDRGKKWVDKNLFNGEYFYQLIDLNDKKIIEAYGEAESIIGLSLEKAYWNEEKEEIKYQLGEGCAVDQVVAQWHANINGLGEIFESAKVKSALESIYKYNFKKGFRNFFNPCRIYSLDDEKGVIICEWPEDVKKPAVPLTYAQETMNGFEYQAAVHMIQEGMVEQGLEIVRAIRERYDGVKRNPWNEFECGSNYARSMASYALLPALSGFSFDMVKGKLGFNPVSPEKGIFRSFWSIDSGWGEVRINEEHFELEVLYGQLRLAELELPFLKQDSTLKLKLSGNDRSFTFNKGAIIFDEEINMQKGDILNISNSTVGG